MFIGLVSAPCFSESLVSNSNRPIRRVSLDNQPIIERSTLVDINSNKTLLYPYTVGVNKCVGTCNTIDDPYVRVCVSIKVKSISIVKV